MARPTKALRSRLPIWKFFCYSITTIAWFGSRSPQPRSRSFASSHLCRFIEILLPLNTTAAQPEGSRRAKPAFLDILPAASGEDSYGLLLFLQDDFGGFLPLDRPMCTHSRVI